MDMDLNNRLTEDETLEQAYDIFLELAADNLDPADVLLFNLQFEERGRRGVIRFRRKTGRNMLISI
ncbi:dsDNA-mimic protein [Escherichia coli]|uniref:DsDNA-mimic protein n=1 Tax=Escherichia coli TaxID=562 RepID=A0A377BHY4_ECOLX|nr:dsDNA-mimic protein [Escherichia coli]